MADLSNVKEHMEVVGSDGGHVGTVDHLQDGKIKLTKSDPAAGGEHHYLSADHVQSVDDKVRLARPANEAKQALGLAA